MRLASLSLFCGAAALSAVGMAGAAHAQSPQTHVMTIALPGGGIEQITYTGNIAPRVIVEPTKAADPFAVAFGGTDPFAMMQAISQEMDRTTAALLQQARALTATPMWLPNPSQLTPAALSSLPPGTSSYSFVSEVDGGNVCSRSMSITYPGNGVAPKVVQHVSGNCGAVGAPAGVPAYQPMQPAKQPNTILVQHRTRTPQPKLVEAAYWPQNRAEATR